MVLILFLSFFCFECSRADAPLSSNINNGTVSPDIFFIVVDSLRADHLGVYGYHRNTCPFIDEIAQQSLIFEKAYSASTYTCESVSAILMGRYPSSTPWSTGWRAQIDPSVTTLSEILKNQGYTMLLFTDHPALEEQMFGKGFDYIKVLTRQFGISGNGVKLVEEILKYINTLDNNKPLFMYVHIYDPHEPYDPPPSYYLRFEDRIYSKPLRLYDEIRFHLPELVQQGFGPGDVRFEDLVLRYDAEIALTDDCIKTLYNSLKKLRANRNAIWLFTADHGEEFLDHGFLEHAWRLYLETIHVPLIIHAPYINSQMRRIDEEVSLVDMFPTLLMFLGITWTDPQWDGIALPLLDWWKGEKKKLPQERIIFSELYLPSRTIGRSLIKKGWQYLNWQQWLTWQECSEYAQKQKQLREEYINGKRQPCSFCAEPEFEELLTPNEKGFPQKSVDKTQHTEMWNYFNQEWKKWCSSRPVMKTDKEKLEINPPQERQKEEMSSEEKEKITSGGYF
ncbi:MAG: sulfatase [Candidatus Hydrogenedens sp.]